MENQVFTPFFVPPVPNDANNRPNTYTPSSVERNEDIQKDASTQKEN